MKNTIITIASVAALTGAANAQTISNIEVYLNAAVGGYAAGDVVGFASVADFLSNTGGTVTNFGGNTFYHRDSVSGFPGAPASSQYYALQKINNELFIGNATVGTATWIAGASEDFSVNQATGALEVFLNTAVGGYAAGDVVGFASVADFLSNTGGTVTNFGGNIAYHRDSVSGFPSNPDYYALHKTNNELFIGNATVGTATWIAGASEDFSVTQVIPEPSSTALLGLGALGLLARRKR